MSQDPSSPPAQVSFGEAVKLVKSKPNRGTERGDLLVRDAVLEPYWHWCRITGISRDEAVEQSTKVYLEEVILVGKPEKVKARKAEKRDNGEQVGTVDSAAPPAAPPAMHVSARTKSEKPSPKHSSARPGFMTWALAGVEGFLMAITLYFSFAFKFPVLDTLVIIAAGGGGIGATVAGGWVLRRRAARRDSNLPVIDAKSLV